MTLDRKGMRSRVQVGNYATFDCRIDRKAFGNGFQLHSDEPLTISISERALLLRHLYMRQRLHDKDFLPFYLSLTRAVNGGSFVSIEENMIFRIPTPARELVRPVSDVGAALSIMAPASFWLERKALVRFLTKAGRQAPYLGFRTAQGHLEFNAPKEHVPPFKSTARKELTGLIPFVTMIARFLRYSKREVVNVDILSEKGVQVWLGSNAYSRTVLILHG
jgi:hypothetical protein